MDRAFPEWSAPPEAELPWSLLRILDEEDQDTGFGAVRSPVGRAEREIFERFAP